MWVAAFNSLPYFHQILAIILVGNIEQQLHLVKDRFLFAANNYRVLAITRSTNSGAISSTVTKEAKLGHLAAFFQGR